MDIGIQGKVVQYGDHAEQCGYKDGSKNNNEVDDGPFSTIHGGPNGTNGLLHHVCQSIKEGRNDDKESVMAKSQGACKHQQQQCQKK
jgi:hypothetical protein